MIGAESDLVELPSVDELLASLVGIKSVNPSLPGASPEDGEGASGRYVKNLLERYDIAVTLQEALPGRYNVIGRRGRGPSADDKVILLSAHMDTYPASNSGPQEYEPRIEAGVLFGRGSADAKGSLAAMLHAFISTMRSPFRREAYVVASVDEEYGLCGCRALALHGLRANLAITGEPTSLTPIYAQKGIVRSRIRITGNVEHAAYPGGRNAVLAAGRALVAIERLNKQFGGVFAPCGLTPSTISPTRISSDGDMNKTPSEVSIWFDARTLPGLSAPTLLETLSDRLRQAVGDNLSLEIDAPYFESPPNLCELENDLVTEFFAKIAKFTGECRPAAFSYGSEAGVLAAISGASLVFGPGDPKYSHGPGERVALREVEAATLVFADLLVSA